MKPERWQRIGDLYHAALELEAARRAVFLEEACAGDEELRREVESLLASHAQAESFMAAPALEVAAGALGEEAVESLVGRRLGCYQLLSLLGAGGMGEVYRARDTKLGRDVALKVLPGAFAHDRERLGRFRREAQVLASLNHPGIGAIYGLEESDGLHVLVLELVPGKTLAELLCAGPLGIEEALRIGSQIAESLEAAHEKGIIHRDLKPANIKVTPEGKAKVLDFGLAKAFAADRPGPDLSGTPTVTEAGTGEGLILGTAGYMSPEQARGKPVDKRTDIWAFGCVLYECLAGRRAFGGATVSDSIAAVLGSEPEWDALPAGTPQNLRNLLRRCLQKDAQKRLRDIGDARIELQEAVLPATVAGRSRNRQRVGWVMALATALGAIGVLLWALLRPASHPAVTANLTMLSPVGVTWSNGFSISPDGRLLVFVGAAAAGQTALYLRPLDSPKVKSLSGTEGASHPFWSPNSRFVGFFAQGKLKKIDISGGPAQALCESMDSFGAWNADGMILFHGWHGPIYRVPDSGGVPTPVTTLDAKRQEISHIWPEFLPDGRHFLFCARSPRPETEGIYIGTLDSNETEYLLGAVSKAVYAPPGYLLFARDGTLLAQRFDLRERKIDGNPFPIADRVETNFSVSGSGVLAYYSSSDSEQLSQLVWFDRMGKSLGSLGPPARYVNPRLSPDGKRVATEIEDPQTGRHSLWWMDISRPVPARFTFDPAGDHCPIWSPDGSRIVFGSERSGSWTLFQKLASGAASEEAILTSKATIMPTDWSSDGQFILYVSGDPRTKLDQWVLPLSGARRPEPVLATACEERQATFAPDGKSMAYTSNDTGHDEVYVQPFPPSGAKWQISTAGGARPIWRGDGKELFYVAADMKLMAVEVRWTPTIEVVGAKALFQTRFDALVHKLSFPYAPTADGQRFLVVTPIEEAAPMPLTVVLNWTALLGK